MKTTVILVTMNATITMYTLSLHASEFSNKSISDANVAPNQSEKKPYSLATIHSTLLPEKKNPFDAGEYDDTRWGAARLDKTFEAQLFMLTRASDSTNKVSKDPSDDTQQAQALVTTIRRNKTKRERVAPYNRKMYWIIAAFMQLSKPGTSCEEQKDELITNLAHSPFVFKSKLAQKDGYLKKAIESIQRKSTQPGYNWSGLDESAVKMLIERAALLSRARAIYLKPWSKASSTDKKFKRKKYEESSTALPPSKKPRRTSSCSISNNESTEDKIRPLQRTKKFEALVAVAEKKLAKLKSQAPLSTHRTGSARNQLTNENND